MYAHMAELFLDVRPLGTCTGTRCLALVLLWLYTNELGLARRRLRADRARMFQIARHDARPASGSGITSTTSCGIRLRTLKDCGSGRNAGELA